MSGAVERGKQANIIVDGNPLENIRSIRNVTMVIKDGHIYDPAERHHLAGFQ